MSSESRYIVSVIGPGRTGTSLLAKILLGLGMIPSPEYTVAAEHNPEGLFEDTEIQSVHKRAISAAGCHPYLPMPEGFLNEPAMAGIQKELIDIVTARTACAGVWGFKDPRTASLIPLWNRVFNRAKVVPRYVLAIRDPAAAVASMHRQYNDSYEVAELVWLWRTCESLYQTGGNCFIVNYERWFEEGASGLLDELRLFTGLTGNADFALSSVVRGNLNRSSYDDYQISNKWVKDLYEVLKDCHGVDFDRDRLMSVVANCRKAMRDFSGWAVMARDAWAKYERVRGAGARKGEALQSASSVRELNEAMIRLKDSQAEVANLRSALRYANRDNEKRRSAAADELQKIKGELRRVKGSIRYRLGAVIINSLSKPGLKTFKLPFQLVKLLRSTR